MVYNYKTLMDFCESLRLMYDVEDDNLPDYKKAYYAYWLSVKIVKLHIEDLHILNDYQTIMDYSQNRITQVIDEIFNTDKYEQTRDFMLEIITIRKTAYDITVEEINRFIDDYYSLFANEIQTSLNEILYDLDNLE